MPAALPSATRATSPSRRLLGLGLGLAVSLALAACPGDDGDGDCGPGAAPPDGLRVFGDGFEARYTMLQAGANNDCPDPNAPAGVISLTIAGIQDGIEPGLITLCVPRPDLFDQATPLGTGALLVDLIASTAGCTIDLTPTPPVGTARASGLCDDGADPAGFALSVSGTVSVDRLCGGTTDTVSLQLMGDVAVAAQ